MIYYNSEKLELKAQEQLQLHRVKPMFINFTLKRQTLLMAIPFLFATWLPI